MSRLAVVALVLLSLAILIPGAAAAAGIIVNPLFGATSEAGGNTTFTIVLADAPLANVTIGLTSLNVAEGVVSPSSVTFTPGNWFIPMTVTVTGQNDLFDDDSQIYVVATAPATSADVNYNGLNASDFIAVNVDDDVADIVVTPTLGLTTTEAGAAATFTIFLASQPTANVTIGLTSNDTSEGTVSPSSVTFTIATWFTPQTITVTGVDDAADDDRIAYAIVTAAATSSDPVYTGRNASDVAVTNTDNELTSGFVISPTVGFTTEAGSAAGFNISLSRAPTANVTIGFASTDLTEGTISPSSFTFTPANYATPQLLSVFPVDDAIADGTVGYGVLTQPATSTDASYNGFDPPDMSLTNLDNDFADIVISQTAGHVTTEAGGVGGFTIRLSSQPTANVTIGLSSSDLTEGTISPSSETFTTANWATPQLVTMTGVDDTIDDESVGWAVVTAAATSSDPTYNGRNAPDVGATNLDNELNGSFVVTPTAGHVISEAGAQGGFNMSLSRAPTANVTIAVSSSDATEGTATPASVTFTPANYASPQLVTINPVDDANADGNVGFAILTLSASSTDPSYNLQNPPDVSVTNNDNDLADVIVTPTSGLITSEGGGSANFTVRLNSQPTANVTIGLSSTNTSEGTVSPSSVTFTAASWATPQTVLVTGVNDALNDCDIPYAIVTAPATSSDPVYSARNACDVTATNADDDDPTTAVGPSGDAIGFALDPIRPNPSRGNALSVRFALPTSGRAELRLLDVSGRLVVTRDVGSMGAGWHTVDLTEAGVGSGVYWVQLVQGSMRRMARVAITR